MAETTTEPGVDQNSGGSNEPLPENNQQQSAAEQQGTGSSEQSQDSGQGRQDDTTHSGDDESLAKFAKGQGIDDLSDLSDREKKLLRVARDNQRDFHAKRVKESEEARQAIDEIHQPSEDENELATDERISNELAQIKAVQRLQDFYMSNPEARDYDAEMGEILVEEAKSYGVESARALARNMPRLLREAKARSGNNAEAAKEAGRREERERLRKAGEAAGETSSASGRSTSSSKLTREDIQNMPDQEYAKRRDEIDALIASGELY